MHAIKKLTAIVGATALIVLPGVAGAKTASPVLPKKTKSPLNLQELLKNRPPQKNKILSKAIPTHGHTFVLATVTSLTANGFIANRAVMSDLPSSTSTIQVITSTDTAITPGNTPVTVGSFVSMLGAVDPTTHAFNAESVRIMRSASSFSSLRTKSGAKKPSSLQKIKK